jgi:uncharacterized membrane protein YqiK
MQVYGSARALRARSAALLRTSGSPRFATVELVDMVEVPIAHVGVVIAFVGKEGTDVTGDSFRHGNLVSKGEKGVWVTPLDPGKYPLNPYTHKVSNVPTANVVLNWATGKTEAHKLDANLSTITVRSADGFKFNLDVSQIIHIPRSDAPKVIARFGGMSALVTQVLEPTIGNYFRNAAQGSDIIDFLKNRSTRQGEARESISAALPKPRLSGSKSNRWRRATMPWYKLPIRLPNRESNWCRTSSRGAPQEMAARWWTSSLPG